jgi:CheY-like chemotaxis protein
MLPTRAYADPLPPFSAGARAEATTTDARPALIVAVAPSEVGQFPSMPFARFDARNTAEALRLMERWRPRVVAVDWTAKEFDASEICAAARRLPGTGILVTMPAPEHAPAALKAGCHAVLLKPLTATLVAGRLGRLSRELPPPAIANRIGTRAGQFGTNRTWPDIACPTCALAGAVAFEYASHRRTWYACLGCDSVWLGRRQE